MHTVPPPIHSLELRDRLSELLKEALRMEGRAAPLYLLRSFEAMVSGQEQSALREELQAERSAAIHRIDAYCRALKRMSRRRSHATDSVDRALEEAAYLFNEGLFFEVHEILETAWLTQTGETRLLLQGLIQIAVGFHHLENRNLMGTISLLKEGVQKLRVCGPDRSRLKLNRFLAQVERAHQSIESLGKAAYDRFDRRMIPKMPLIRVHCRT
jgi:predicted metal-dependent hydrolase